MKIKNKIVENIKIELKERNKTIAVKQRAKKYVFVLNLHGESLAQYKTCTEI